MSKSAVDEIPDPDRNLTPTEIFTLKLVELKEECDRREVYRLSRDNKEELRDRLVAHFGYQVNPPPENRITIHSNINKIRDGLKKMGIIGIAGKNKDELYSIYTLSPIKQVPYLSREFMIEKLKVYGVTGYSGKTIEEIRARLLQAERESPHLPIDKHAVLRDELMKKQVTELKQMAKDRGVPGYAHARKKELVELMLPKD